MSRALVVCSGFCVDKGDVKLTVTMSRNSALRLLLMDIASYCFPGAPSIEVLGEHTGHSSSSSSLTFSLLDFQKVGFHIFRDGTLFAHVDCSGAGVDPSATPSEVSVQAL